jgi:putative ABC transport system ATP-binding protein
MPTLLTATGLVKTFSTGAAQTPVLRGVSMAVEAGDWVAIMGPSGCGKSTLLHLLGGLDAPDEGSVVLDGIDIARLDVAGRAKLRRAKVGYVFQQYNLIPHLDVAANVELPQRLVHASRHDAHARGAELLGTLGLAERADALPATLSGGEQQRVAIARALANRPELLLADEPTGALDSGASAVVMDLLAAQHATGQTIVMVTHDPGVAARANRVVRLRDGVVEAEMTAAAVGR